MDEYESLPPRRSVARRPRGSHSRGAAGQWRCSPKDQEKLSITLSKPVTAAANLSGDIRSTKPSPKSGPSTDVVNIAPAPL
jgi:hypothetical protein